MFTNIDSHLKLDRLTTVDKTVESLQDYYSTCYQIYQTKKNTKFLKRFLCRTKKKVHILPYKLCLSTAV